MKITHTPSKLFSIVAVFPMTTGVILLIHALYSFTDIFLEPPFSLSINAVFASSCLHLTLIIKWKKIALIGPELSLFKKIIVLLLLIILFFLMHIVFIVGLKMNLNYWLRSNVIEKIEISVQNKRISRGWATDHYIYFYSPIGKLSNKVRRKNYNSFKIEETYVAYVNKGYFGGYFLTEKPKLLVK